LVEDLLDPIDRSEKVNAFSIQVSRRLHERHPNGPHLLNEQQAFWAQTLDPARG
jgi:hypothetical protein